MKFFRPYLLRRGRGVRIRGIRTEFSEDDEAAVAWFLVEARLRKSARELLNSAVFTAPETIPTFKPLLRQVRFVACFMCFFISKPTCFEDEMNEFCRYFIPNFAHDGGKRAQLARSLRPGFFSATVRDLEQAQTLDQYFDITDIRAKAEA